MYRCIGPVLILFRTMLFIFAYIVWVSGFQPSFGFLSRTLRKKGTYAFAWELGKTSSWVIQEVLLSSKSRVTEDKILRC